MYDNKELNKINFFQTVVEIAGVVIQICTDLPQLKSVYQQFETNQKPDITIYITEKDIDDEMKKQDILNPGYSRRIVLEKSTATETVLVERGNVRSFENMVICRKVAEELLPFESLLMHGAVVSIDNNSFLFTAPSGTGKTTHILKWLEQLPDAFVVNGDKPFIKFFPNNESLPPLACGSPWAGKENMYTNKKIPLKAIIYMERAEENSIHEIPFAEAFPLLLQQTYRPDSEENMRKTLELLQRLNGKVKLYRFQCNNLKKDCFDVAYNALVS